MAAVDVTDADFKEKVIDNSGQLAPLYVFVCVCVLCVCVVYVCVCIIRE